MQILKYSFSAFLFLGLSTRAFCEESVLEKAEAAANKVVRTTKKGINRTAEALCGKLTGDNKLECLAKKAKNRVEETSDAVVDKASEAKNAIDSK